MAEALHKLAIQHSAHLPNLLIKQALSDAAQASVSTERISRLATSSVT